MLAPILERSRPGLALAGGLAATLALTVLAVPLHDRAEPGLPALLLVVPVVATAVFGGRAPGFIVAAFATLSFGFALPPFGSPRVRVSADLVALVVFSAVAFVVSALVTTKVSALNKVDEQRRALLRSVSHDLRTPLAAIHAVATDLRSGAAYDDQTRDRVLDVLIDETEHLDRLVANLLSMSRIEAGTMRPHPVPLDVAALVEMCADRLERLFRTWKLVVDVPEDLPLVCADPAQIEQLLNNLLENVVRHTPEGTCARVTARSLPDAVEISVADDGPGIPPAIRERINTSSIDTTNGVGLAICQRVIALHHGAFTTESSQLGAHIAFTLPRDD